MFSFISSPFPCPSQWHTILFNHKNITGMINSEIICCFKFLYIYETTNCYKTFCLALNIMDKTIITQHLLLFLLH